MYDHRRYWLHLFPLRGIEITNIFDIVCWQRPPTHLTFLTSIAFECDLCHIHFVPHLGGEQKTLSANKSKVLCTAKLIFKHASKIKLIDWFTVRSLFFSFCPCIVQRLKCAKCDKKFKCRLKYDLAYKWRCLSCWFSSVSKSNSCKHERLYFVCNFINRVRTIIRCCLHLSRIVAAFAVRKHFCMHKNSITFTERYTYTLFSSINCWKCADVHVKNPLAIEGVSAQVNNNAFNWIRELMRWIVLPDKIINQEIMMLNIAGGGLIKWNDRCEGMAGASKRTRAKV